jgi:site-specific recombinase XerD
MLERFFRRSAAVARHRQGLLGPYLDSFVADDGDVGYRPLVVRRRCWALGRLGRWLARRHIDVANINAAVVEQYLRCRRRRRRQLGGEEAPALKHFVEHLRKLGVAVPDTPATPSASETLVGRYRDYLVANRAVVPATVGNYVPFVRRFLLKQFGDGTVRLRDVQPSDVSRFVVQSATVGRTGRAKVMVSALRSFFRFLLYEGAIDIDLAGVVPGVAGWRLSAVPKYLRPSEIKLVLQTCNRRTAVGRRNYAILLLLTRLGLRACEVARMELDDIDWRAGELVVRGKGSSRDRVPMPSDVGQAMVAYLRRDRPSCTTRRVFLRSLAPIRGLAPAGSVNAVARTAIRAAGLDPPSKGAHLLRHSLATTMLRSGATLAEVGQILRHRSVLTTQIYAKVDFDGLRQVARPWPRTEGGS